MSRAALLEASPTQHIWLCNTVYGEKHTVHGGQFKAHNLARTQRYLLKIILSLLRCLLDCAAPYLQNAFHSFASLINLSMEHDEKGETKTSLYSAFMDTSQPRKCDGRKATPKQGNPGKHLPLFRDLEASRPQQCRQTSTFRDFEQSPPRTTIMPFRIRKAMGFTDAARAAGTVPGQEPVEVCCAVSLRWQYSDRPKWIK